MFSSFKHNLKFDVNEYRYNQPWPCTMKTDILKPHYLVLPPIGNNILFDRYDRWNSHLHASLYFNDPLRGSIKYHIT